MFGFLNIYKPKGITSHDVVTVLRKITGVKQIGHTGTLDPFAEGVLPICIGKATKLIEYLKDDKAYIGTVKLGEATDTYDSEGKVTKSSDKLVNIDLIESILPEFRGNLEQIPPIYSAIKVNGKKLYEYARKGETVDIKPRQVTIDRLEVLSFDNEKRELKLLIECSRGTYIRSLANDIGELLETFGYLNKLVRIKAGNFKVEDSIKLDEITSESDVMKYMINPLKYLDYPCYNVPESEYIRLANGNALKADSKSGITILATGNDIVGVGISENGYIKPKKVFI